MLENILQKSRPELAQAPQTKALEAILYRIGSITESQADCACNIAYQTANDRFDEVLERMRLGLADLDGMNPFYDLKNQALSHISDFEQIIATLLIYPSKACVDQDTTRADVDSAGLLGKYRIPKDESNPSAGYKFNSTQFVEDWLIKGLCEAVDDCHRNLDGLLLDAQESEFDGLVSSSTRCSLDESIEALRHQAQVLSRGGLADISRKLDNQCDSLTCFLDDLLDEASLDANREEILDYTGITLNTLCDRYRAVLSDAADAVSNLFAIVEREHQAVWLPEATIQEKPIARLDDSGIDTVSSAHLIMLINRIIKDKAFALKCSEIAQQ
jgi:hypothetical protein